jgi:CheY-like chemotaxis protein
VVRPTTAWIASDTVLIERVLLNLVSNAVRYTSRGGVLVGCRKRGGMLRIEVYDTGRGIPESQREKIFGEFYQVAEVEQESRGGLGLGLAIVERLCRLLDHPLELTSTVGRGSRFAVLVPLATAQADVAAPAPPITADTPSGKLVLVVDDDALVRDGMRGLLHGWGCNVVTAASEDAAVAGLIGRPPDLIISDSRLADGVAGIDVIARLRASFGTAIPAFLISGDTGPDRLREARASGHHLLHKPVHPMMLRAMLGQLLKAGSQAGAP